MAAPKCKNGCGRDTNQIKGSNPPKYHDICTICNNAKNAGGATTGGTTSSKSNIKITGEDIKKFNDRMVVKLDLKTDPGTVIRVKHDVDEMPPAQADDSTGEWLYQSDFLRKTDAYKVNVRFISEKGSEAFKLIEVPALETVATSIKIILQEVKIVGDEIEVKFEIKTNQPKTSVIFMKGFVNLEPARITDKNGKRIFTRLEKKTEGGKTVSYRFVVDDLAADEVSVNITLPEFEKAKPLCPHCNNTKICDTDTIGGIRCSCEVCLVAANTTRRMAKVICSFCASK